MRSAIACVFFALIVQRGSLAGVDFRPTPIPLAEWRDDERAARAGTLHEVIKTEAPPTIAAIPAHYWEDALRHSVYLTLVRDKIDQLIAKGDVISPDTKPDQPVSKEVDDHDLWEKIKTAPFDRIAEEDPSTFGDVAIMARGRLLEDKNGFRFTEDERSKEKCADDKCMDGVIAIWSVKRIRQRDHETSPGRYHYELTFSVISQTPKKQRKPYENPIRTFTVRESTPDRITEAPQEHKKHETLRPQVMRPERAVWIHRNIVPKKYHLGRSYYHGLDRIFSSFFSDDDDESTPESTPRHKSNTYVSQSHPHYSKTGYVGAPTDQHQQNVKYTPYPYKQPVKHSRPLPPPPLAASPHHYLDIGSAESPSGGQYTNDNQYNNANSYSNGNPYSNGNQYSNENYNNGIQYAPTNQHNNGNQYSNGNQHSNGNQYTNSNNNGNHYNNGNPHTLQSDYKYSTSNKPVRTTRPAVLPTPLPQVPPTKEMTFDISNAMRFRNDTTHIPETITIYKNYNKFRSPPGKVNYFSEHVRPPVYNAPPGVFATMDKKPFKPMPPLKLMPTPKPTRNNRPIDFRPSPQILDNQSTEKDSFIETAFRPINTNYPESNYTDYSEIHETSIKNDDKQRKPNRNKKPSKKHESQRATTNAPDIITAATSTEDEIETMEWANILGAFTKTTPMASPTEKFTTAETTTPLYTTESASNAKRKTTSTTEAVPVSSTSSTNKPKKRTRPPPKFVKQDKVKKYKRVPTNATSNLKSTEKSGTKRPIKDLTPQASSAALSSTKSLMESTSKKTPMTTLVTTISTTTIPTTTTTTTTAAPTSSSTSSATTTFKTTTATVPRSTTTKTLSTTARPTTTATGLRNINRFRQSTLILKGTSVKHDKWSSKNQTIASAATHRRKGSNFQGYLSSTTPNISDQEDRKRHHPDRVSGFALSTTESAPITEPSTQSTTTQQRKEESDSLNETTANQEEEYDESEEDKNTEEETNDNTEFIFQSTTIEPDDNNKDVFESEENITSETVETTPHTVAKNKTKCKKKKTNNEENFNAIKDNPSTTTTTTEKSTTRDIFQDLFDFNFGGTSEKDNEISSPKPKQEEESENHEKYLKIDEDFKDFLDNLGEKESSLETSTDAEENYDDDDDKELPSIDDEDSDTPTETENAGRQSNDDNDYEEDRPYSFLELLAME